MAQEAAGEALLTGPGYSPEEVAEEAAEEAPEEAKEEVMKYMLEEELPPLMDRSHVQFVPPHERPAMRVSKRPTIRYPDFA